MAQRGFYRHYKGGIYFVHGVAKNMDEGGADLVIYSSIQCGPEELRYRPVAEFEEIIDAPSEVADRASPPFNPVSQFTYKTPRFKRVEEW